MNAPNPMSTLRCACAALALVACAAQAQTSRTPLESLTPAQLAQPSVARAGGDHPAVVVQRLYSRQGYDYASKFYPHPAWLYLSAEAPRPMSDHPAVIVWREHQRREAPLRVAVPAAAIAPASQP